MVHSVKGQDGNVQERIDQIWEIKNSNVPKALAIAERLKISKKLTANDSLQLFDLLASLYKDVGDYTQSKKNYKTLTRLSIAHKNVSMKFKATLGLADILRHQGDYDSAVLVCQQTIIEAETGGYLVESAEALTELGDIFRMQGQADLAYAKYLQARDILNKLDEEYIMSKVNFGFAEIFHLQKKYGQAENLFKEVLRVRKEIGNTEAIAEAYSRIGNTYETKDDQKTAFAYFDSARVIFNKLENLRGIANSKRKIGKIYRRWQLYDSARANFKSASAIFQSIGDKRQYSKTLRQIAIVYRKQDKYDSTILYAQKAASIAKGIGFSLGFYNAYLEVVTAYDKAGEYKKALEHQKELTTAQQELMQTSFDNKIKATEASNDLQKSLSEKEQEFNALQNSTHNKTIVLLSILAVLLILFIVFAYKQYLRDVRQLKKIKAQNKLIRSRNKEIALRIDELKQFAYITSHDLQTPLMGIVKIADWLSRDHKDKLSKQGVELLDLMRSRVRRMESMLNGILAYFKIGSTTLKPELIDLPDLISEVLESINPDKEVSLDLGNENIKLKADRSQLKQVLYNLIDNSILHNDKPFVTLNIGFENKKNRWSLYVKDNGPGIEPGFLKKAFDIFQQVNKEDENRTGIGLAIVKRIVAGWDSTISIDSNPGLGSTVYLHLNSSMTSTARVTSKTTFKKLMTA